MTEFGNRQGSSRAGESLRRYREIFEKSRDGCVIVDLHGRIIDANKAYCEMLGYSLEELCKLKNFYEITPEKWREWENREIWQNRLLKKGYSGLYEKEYIRKDGTVFPVELQSYVARDESGNIDFLWGMARDITESKKAEEKLRQSEARFRGIFENVQDVYYEVKLNGTILNVSPSIEDLSRGQFRREDVIGKNLPDFYADPNQRGVLLNLLRQRGSITDYEVALRNRDGSIVPCAISARLQRDSNGYPVKIIGNVRDITRRKKAEEALRRQLKYERGLVEASACLLKPDRSHQNIQKALSCLCEAANVARVYIFENFEDPADGLCMRQRFEFCSSDASPEIDNPLLQHVVYQQGFERWRKTMSTGKPIQGPVAGFPDEEKAVLVSQGILSLLVLPLFAGSKWWGFIGFDETRKERIWHEEEVALLGTAADIFGAYFFRLSAEEDLYKQTEAIKASMDGVAILDANQKYVYLNDAHARIYGYDSPEELLGKSWTVLYNEKELARFKNKIMPVFAESGHWRGEATGKKRDGSLFPQEVSLTALRDGGLICLVRDITGRKKAELEQEQLREQLAQAQKMESVGRLAGGVAHDFNNMLNVIIGNADLALDGLPEEHRIYGELKEIQSAAQRSAELTRQLLAFARRQTVAPKILDLNETIESMLKMLRRLIGEDIKLHWRPGHGLDLVRMDPAQIDQMLANLVVNARDAITSGKGEIIIETGQAEFDREYCAHNPDLSPGSYITLAISDNGRGMDEETRAQVFEPFFTTKDVGEGTGLGLATVYGIVRQNQGTVRVYSEPDIGTTFRVYLPVYSAGGKGGPEEPDLASEPEHHGTETILLVEDEPAILTLGGKMLEKLGYDVVTAVTPGQAVRLAEEHRGDIHLLITDVVMPEMNGRELAKRLLSLYPNIKRLFMSGYTANVIAHQGVLEEGMNFIQKPFTRQELGQKVREVLAPS